VSFSHSKYIKIDVGWRFAPDPTGAAYSAPPDLLASRQKGMEGRGGKD